MHGNTTKNSKMLMAIGITTLFILSVLASGCLNVPQKGEPEKGKVRVGYLTGDLHHLAYFVAKNQTINGGKSFFEKNGVIVEDALTGGYANGGAEMDDFSAGKNVDLGYMGAPPSITKYLNLKGQPNTRVISQVNEIGSSLVVAKNINNVSELKGKTIAVPSHSAIQYFLLLTYLKNNGIEIGTSADQISAVDTPVGNMKIKLETGEIAGFIAWEPFPTDAIQSGIGKVLIRSNEIWNNHLDCVIVANKDFANANKTLIEGFLKAHIQATDWINNAKKDENSNDYKQLVEIAKSFTGRNETVVKQALKEINYKYSIDDNFISSFTTYTDKLIEYGIVGNDKLSALGYSYTANFVSDYVEESYLNNAMKE